MAAVTAGLIRRETIEEIARKIAERFRPYAIVLFGSYAREEAGEDSDVDLLVVTDELLPRGRRSAPIIRAVAEEYALPVDVIVRSRETFERGKKVPESFCGQVVREGIVLYERA